MRRLCLRIACWFYRRAVPAAERERIAQESAQKITLPRAEHAELCTLAEDGRKFRDRLARDAAFKTAWERHEPYTLAEIAQMQFEMNDEFNSSVN